MSGKIIHMKITISGFVQGVGFRYAALHAARKTGVKGYIRNLPDGNVYIEAEGERTKLNEFVSWCHEGPPYAQVGNVVISEGIAKDFVDFDIRI